MESETELQIFNCIDNDDVEGLKSLMHYPNLFQIEDDDGLTILQKAICQESFEVFDFLLSLDDCPINARNSKGERAIQFALEGSGSELWEEKFIYPLLKKGADVDWGDSQENEALKLALSDDRLDVVQNLLEKGWDLNYQDSETGQTPFHSITYYLLDYGEELLAMVLYFGGDPSIPDFDGFTPIDLAFKVGYLSESMLEHLVFYFFDDYCPGYTILIDSLFSLLQLDSPLIPQILKHITSVNFDLNYALGSFQRCLKKIFVIKPENLKLLLEKFDYVVEAILDYFLEREFIKHVSVQEVSIENCNLLLQSRFSSDVIQIIGKIPISSLIRQPESANKPHSEIINLSLFLLSYGAEIYDFDLEVVYRKFGDCEFFRMLLHMDITITQFRRYDNDIMPGIVYDIHMDMETFLRNPNRCECSPEALRQLLNYFAHPKLKNFCYSLPIQNEDIHAKVKDLPSVPLLVELARNQVRKFLIKKYKIKNSMQFYTLIKHLPISKVHQKIITLETKLY